MNPGQKPTGQNVIGYKAAKCTRQCNRKKSNNMRIITLIVVDREFPVPEPDFGNSGPKPDPVKFEIPGPDPDKVPLPVDYW